MFAKSIVEKNTLYMRSYQVHWWISCEKMRRFDISSAYRLQLHAECWSKTILRLLVGCHRHKIGNSPSSNGTIQTDYAHAEHPHIEKPHASSKLASLTNFLNKNLLVLISQKWISKITLHLGGYWCPMPQRELRTKRRRREFFNSAKNFSITQNFNNPNAL